MAKELKVFSVKDVALRARRLFARKGKNMATPEQRAVRIIEGNRYLTIGTSDKRGPWVAPISYVWLTDGAFTYYSATEARHSVAGSVAGQVVGAIYDSSASSDDADGIQFVAQFSEVTPDELPDVMGEYFEKSFPDPSIRSRWVRPPADFHGDALQRFYRLVLVEAYVPDENSPRIDRRVSVDLDQVNALRTANRK